MLQLTWDNYQADFCVKDNRVCNHHECCISNETKCCAGCQSAKTCTSRCKWSYKMVSTDRELLARHISNGLPVLLHNCGQVLCTHDGFPYVIVLED